MVYAVGVHFNKFNIMEIYVLMHDNMQPYEDNQTCFHKAFRNEEEAKAFMEEYNNRQWECPTMEDYLAEKYASSHFSYEDYCDDSADAHDRHHGRLYLITGELI